MFRKTHYKWAIFFSILTQPADTYYLSACHSPLFVKTILGWWTSTACYRCNAVCISHMRTTVLHIYLLKLDDFVANIGKYRKHHGSHLGFFYEPSFRHVVLFCVPHHAAYKLIRWYGMMWLDIIPCIPREWTQWIASMSYLQEHFTNRAWLPPGKLT